MPVRGLPIPLVILAAACGGDAAVVHRETLPGGIAVVRNDRPSGWSDTVGGWRIVPAGEIVIAPGTPGELARPFSPVVGAGGALTILDRRPAQLKQFGPDGAWRRTFSREGAGPGEISPRTRIAAAAGHLFAVDRATNRLVLFDTAGTVRAERPLTEGIFPDDVDGLIDWPEAVMAARWGTDHGLVWLDTLLAERHRITLPAAPPERMWEACRFVIPLQPTTLGVGRRDRQAIWGRSDALRFVLTRNGRDTVRIVEGTMAPAAVTAADRDRYFTGPDAITAICPSARAEDLPATRPIWSSLHEDGAGNLWIALSGRGRYTVFSADGVWLGDVPIPFDANNNIFWRGDTALEFQERDDGTLVVRRWTVRRSS